MKLRHCLLIAALGLGTVLAPGGASAKDKETKNLDVLLTCLTCTPPIKSQHQSPARKADGTFSVNLPLPGNYTITAASGPNKGKLLWSGEITNAGSISIPAQFGGTK